MDYSKPLDAELFPEGCERCSLTKFLGWMSFLGVIFLWGLYAAVRVLGFGLGETGMDDYFGFGLWITFDLAVIALGAGAFFTGALRYILNIDELKNIGTPSLSQRFTVYSTSASATRPTLSVLVSAIGVSSVPSSSTCTVPHVLP